MIRGELMGDLTKGTPLKQIVLFSVPLIIGNLFQMLYSVMDTLIVGRTLGRFQLSLALRQRIPLRIASVLLE